MDDKKLKSSGASGVVHKGNVIQVIYGPQVAVIKSNLVDFMDSPEADRMTSATASVPKAEPVAKTMPEIILGAHMTGTVVALSDFKD